MNSEQEPLSETERDWNQILPHLRHDSDRRHGCGVYHFRTGRRTPIGPKLGIEDGFYPNFCSDAKNAPKSTEDTKYKQRFFSVLEKAFNVGKMKATDGPAEGTFRLVFEDKPFPDLNALPAETRT